ncbi:polyprenyl synthetase family protein [Pseudomonas sp. p50]|uniref:polyprenyl synthetase family protein n=1 Tax=Pseudomonas sp. p50(2008) TaxID=2816832 RepID=UPI00188B5501|nr:polyprenyl synthetase family protein [Pseudomonas sp. p50(2008)]MBF4557487.1 polyprenyl synthetase family protein [Pseudomonas sp. p50(2008)]
MTTLPASNYLTAKSHWASPFKYQEHYVGKNIRTHLAYALVELYQLKQSVAQTLSQVVEKFNTASLVHDDLIDQDRIRRGAPSVWAKFGKGTALVSGMYGYIEGLQKLGELNDLPLVNIGIRSLETLHVGQYLDIQASNGHVLPTLEEYRLIAEANTGCFFLFLLDSCQHLHAMKEELYMELKSLLLELSVYYRYVNDYCDLNHIPHFKKKGFAPDLEGGPKSFVMILANKTLIKKKLTDKQKREIIIAFGNAAVFSEALTVMEASFDQVQHNFANIRCLSEDRNCHALNAFLESVHFQQHPQDNYFNNMNR